MTEGLRGRRQRRIWIYSHIIIPFRLIKSKTSAAICMVRSEIIDRLFFKKPDTIHLASIQQHLAQYRDVVCVAE